jgi:hypothetical protein
MSTTTTTNNTNTTNTTNNPQQYTGGNTKYMVNGVNHMFTHCIINTQNNFIVCYGTQNNIQQLLKVYNNNNYIIVNMLSNTKVHTKVQQKTIQQQQKLQQKLQQLQQKLNPQ